ncbi:MAG: Fic family protein [Granulosicoccaceae bacterium]
MTTFQLEPCLPSSSRKELDDLALALASKSRELASQLRPEIRESIADLVRSMNCYYSNLIEGHNTHPRDIDRALSERYSDDPKKRELQYEARAHIEVQRLIDQGNDPDCSPYSSTHFQWIHREFYRRIPEEQRWIENPDTGRKVEIKPGELRDGGVAVGDHIPPKAEELDEYLSRFEQAYTGAHLSNIQSISAVAAAHHRFVWIHPFFDGNGRVARLMSHATFKRIGMGDGVWSVSRGLARSAETYKAKLKAADQRRQGDLDGRGARSEKALVEFCEYFLSTSIDQVEFMEDLLQPGELLRRMKLYCDDEMSAGRLPKRSMALLKEALIMGQFERGRAPEITGYQERKGRQILSELLNKGLLISTGPRNPVRLGFPLEVVERWFPTLYPVN